MLDKNVLQQWIKFQQYRHQVKSANMVVFEVLFETNGRAIEAQLYFKEDSIKIRPRDPRMSPTYEIRAENLQGCRCEETKLVLNLPGGQLPYIFMFGTSEAQKQALGLIQHILNEDSEVDTPPSSGSSSSGSSSSPEN